MFKKSLLLLGAIAISGIAADSTTEEKTKVFLGQEKDKALYCAQLLSKVSRDQDADAFRSAVTFNKIFIPTVRDQYNFEINLDFLRKDIDEESTEQEKEALAIEQACSATVYEFYQSVILSKKQEILNEARESLLKIEQAGFGQKVQ